MGLGLNATWLAYQESNTKKPMFDMINPQPFISPHNPVNPHCYSNSLGLANIPEYTQFVLELFTKTLFALSGNQFHAIWSILVISFWKKEELHNKQ